MEFDYRGLSQLIKVASTSRVRRIKLGEHLEVEFDVCTIEERETSAPTAAQEVEGEPAVEVTPQDEMTANEMQFSELIYTNPLEYERLQAEG